MTTDQQQQNAANETLPLFYTKPEPLSADVHVNLALRQNFGFNYTKGVNAVPLNLIEMPQVCHAYPIAFSPDSLSTPVAILGLRDGENLFLHEDGSWEEDTYIPAYIRRYPFIFSELPDTDQLTLCVDMNDEVIEDNGEQRFFSPDQQPTDLAKNALEFCKSYHAAAQQTLEFGQTLNDLGLLIEREAQVDVNEETRINFSGFRIIDESKLMNLDDATFLEFRQKNWLPFIYAHLFSAGQWQNLAALLRRRMANGAA